MGIGMVLVVSAGDAEDVLAHLKVQGETALIMGEVCA
jgi:phosphoribosylaminoimidazole (AIR) synthetase